MPPVKSEPVSSNQDESNSLAPLYPDEEQYEDYPEEEHYEHYNQSHQASGEVNKGNDRSVLKKFISREVASNEMGTSVVFRCTLCGKTAAQKNNLLNHIEGIHFPNSFRYNCPYCAKTLTTKNALSVHVHTTHKQQQPQPLVFQNLPGMPGGLTFPTLPMPPFPMPALPSPKP